ncbi:hypothetical protein D1872_305520 [compost metagenome]
MSEQRLACQAKAGLFEAEQALGQRNCQLHFLARICHRRRFRLEQTINFALRLVSFGALIVAYKLEYFLRLHTTYYE